MWSLLIPCGTLKIGINEIVDEQKE